MLAVNDHGALAAVQTAHQLGLRVPHDVAVMGAGSSAEGAQLLPALTSVGVPDGFARYAELLRVRALGRRHEPSVHTFDWVIQRQGSTA